MGRLVPDAELEGQGGRSGDSDDGFPWGWAGSPAHGGQTVLSGATEPLVVDRLPDGVWLNVLGSYQLRDLRRPERVVQLCHPDLRNEFPPLRVRRAVASHNVSAQLTSFIGRQRQMAELRKIVADTRLVTLTGAGGAGKTRLAVEFTSQLVTAFSDEVWYVDLAPALPTSWSPQPPWPITWRRRRIRG